MSVHACVLESGLLVKVPIGYSEVFVGEPKLEACIGPFTEVRFSIGLIAKSVSVRIQGHYKGVFGVIDLQFFTPCNVFNRLPNGSLFFVDKKIEKSGTLSLAFLPKAVLSK